MRHHLDFAAAPAATRKMRRCGRMSIDGGHAWRGFDAKVLERAQRRDTASARQQNPRLSRSPRAYNSSKGQSTCRIELEDVMEYKTLDAIRDVADILPVWQSPRRLSKHERLEYWAEALEREGGRPLNTLFEIEYARPAQRAAMHVD